MCEGLEFYQDLDGFIADDLNRFSSATTSECIARQTSSLPYPELQLEPQTMETRPLGDWGVAQAESNASFGLGTSGGRGVPRARGISAH